MQTKIIDAYPLSHLQEGLLFQAEYTKDPNAYFVQIVLHLRNIKSDILREAWDIVTNQHDILKSGVLWEGLNEPVLYISEQVDVPFEVHNWEEINGDLETFIKTDRTRGFDLTKAPLMRISLIQKSEIEFVMIWSFHHMILDGWSSAIILGEVFQAYSHLLSGKSVVLRTRKPYREYIGWLTRQDESKIEEFWNRYLHGIPDTTQLSFKGLIEADEIDYRVQEYEFSEEQTWRLQNFCKNHNVTANTVLIGALGAVLKRYLNQEEVVIGMTTSGRSIDLPGIEDMVGLFINTLPIRMKFNGQTTTEYLASLQEDIQELTEFGNVSLAKLQKLSGYGKDLFNVLFVYENYPVDNSSLEMVEISESRCIEKTEYPLSVDAYLSGSKLIMRYTYQTEHFDQKTVGILAKYLESFLEKVVENPNVAVDRTDILTEEEKKQQLVEWNGTTVKYPKDKCIYELFEEQVEKSPDAVAVVFEDKHLTYGELNARSNQLARYLRKQGIKADDLVGICIKRSLEMIIGILGILKAGGAYVPLDPSYPKDRLDYMKSDSEARIVIDAEYLQNKAIWQEQKENLKRITNSQNLAYVIYTSGSTGKPKGAQLNHQGVVNHLFIKVRDVEISDSSVIAQTAKMSFDISVWQSLAALICGGITLILKDDDVWNVDALVNQVNRNRVTIFEIVPTLFSSLLSNEKTEFSSLKKVLLTGEALNSSLCREWFKKFSIPLINAYGPTECSDDITHNLMEASSEIVSGIAPIGHSLANLHVVVIDENFNLRPRGCVGEIVVYGDGVGRGYLKRPDLTAEKFIANPFGNGGRLY